MPSRQTRSQNRRERAVAPETREEQILDAAARLFREHSFAGTGLRDIASAAGILLGSLQYRFPSKESLMVRLMERAVDGMTRTVLAAVASTSDPIERLRLGLAAHLRGLVSGDDAVYVLLYDWRVLSGDARAAIVRLRDRYEALWDGMIYEAAGTGKLRSGLDLRLFRLLGFGAINWVATWYRPGGPLTLDQVADEIFRTMALGVLSDDARAKLLERPADRAKPIDRHASRSRRGRSPRR